MRALKFRSISSLKPFPKESLHKLTIRSAIRKIIPLMGIGKYIGNFFGVSCFTSTIGELKNRAAIAIPGIGIFIHPKDAKNISLLRHEFGHIFRQRNGASYSSIDLLPRKASIVSADQTEILHLIISTPGRNGLPTGYHIIFLNVLTIGI